MLIQKACMFDSVQSNDFGRTFLICLILSPFTKHWNSMEKHLCLQSWPRAAITRTTNDCTPCRAALFDNCGINIQHSLDFICSLIRGTVWAALKQRDATKTDPKPKQR